MSADGTTDLQLNRKRRSQKAGHVHRDSMAITSNDGSRTTGGSREGTYRAQNSSQSSESSNPSSYCGPQDETKPTSNVRFRRPDNKSRRRPPKSQNSDSDDSGSGLDPRPPPNRVGDVCDLLDVDFGTPKREVTADKRKSELLGTSKVNLQLFQRNHPEQVLNCRGMVKVPSGLGVAADDPFAECFVDVQIREPPGNVGGQSNAAG
eukprot:Lankesteria_metandrocarpae@DN2099_c0_g1_i1.p1